MNPVAAMLVAYACISYGNYMPDGFNMTQVHKCTPPRVEAAAAVPVKPVRKMASRCDGTASECKISRAECGQEFADWRTSKGRRKFRCR